MNLDEQLAALAAGELDDDEARAVHARVAGDPALQQRLARLRQLEETLTGWEVEPLRPDEVAALDDRVTAALDALADEPLDQAADPAVPSLAEARARRDQRRAAARDADRRATAAAADDDGVTSARAPVPDGGASWTTGLVAAAAALVAIVGVGTTGLLDGGEDGGDTAALEATADAPGTDRGEAVDEAARSEAEGAQLSQEETSDASTDGAQNAEQDAEDAGATVRPPPVVAPDLVLADRNGLATLVGEVTLPGLAAQFPDSAQGETDAGDDAAAAPSPVPAGELVDSLARSLVVPRACVRDELDRLGASERLALVGTAVVDGVDALVVVVATQDGSVVTTSGRAVDARTCQLLDAAEATR